MLLDFKHGGHALTEPAPGSKKSVVLEPEIDSMTPFRYLIDPVGEEDLLQEGEDTIKALDELGKAMVDQPNQDSDSTIPPVYTYWAQFIDHELTARTDRDENVSDIRLDTASLRPAKREDVEKGLLNRRTPAIELDAVYGDGPPGRHGDKIREKRAQRIDLAKCLRDGAKMRVGTANVGNRPPPASQPGAPQPETPDLTIGLPVGPIPPSESDLNRDLPRIGALIDLGVVKEDDFPDSMKTRGTLRQQAFIGDPRNDENLAVAQFHVAMLRFHNAVVDWLNFKDPQPKERSTDELFEDSRRIVRWVFQWLVVNDFLKTLLDPVVVDKVLAGGAELYRKGLAGPVKRDKGSDVPYMPLEFSVAAYRFGHSMIRNGYDYNRNFGNKPDGSPGFVRPFATLVNFFEFTGKSPAANPADPSVPGPFRGGSVLPHNWIIEWDRFDGSSPGPGRVARKIDTRLAPTLGNLPNEGNDPADAPFKELLKQLAKRNLRRGYQLSLPTGQAVALALGVKPLSPDELGQNGTEAMKQALGQGGFFERTPLWFYVLKEAEVRGEGNRLGEVGSRIVAETIIGVLFADPESYLSNDPGWDPSKPVPESGGPLKLKDGRTIAKIGDLFEFAGVKPSKVETAPAA